MIHCIMYSIVAGRLNALRRARGLSQRALANAAGVTRQAVGAIESGRMQPGVRIALALARALGTTVEELFEEAHDAPRLEPRVASGKIGGQIVTHPLDRDHLAIEPCVSGLPTSFVAGCDLAVGLLSRHAMLRTRDARVLWLPMTNRSALEMLSRGQVHAAVIHGMSPVRVASADRFDRFELATTEEGWLVTRGNPYGFRGARDVISKRMRLVNRPVGSGARRVLDDQFRRVRVDAATVPGYECVVEGQLDAARAVAQGFADAAVGMASAARLYGLDFIPVREERCTLFVTRGTSHALEVRILIDALRSGSYRRDLSSLQSYDVTRTGESIK
jgi:putative molybdopterin biosynthesis protein